MNINLSKTLRYKLALFSFFLLISFVFLFPIFTRFSYWGIQDWDYEIFQYAVPKATILNFKQFPLWNPYSHGGMPLLANPQSKPLSPFYPLMLLFDVFKAIKILILLNLTIGLLGTFYLARHFKLNLPSSLIASITYMLNSSYFLIIVVGMSSFFLTSYIPWTFLFFLKSFKNLKYAFLSSLFLSLMFLGGGVQLVGLTTVFLFCYGGLLFLFKKQKLVKILKSLFIISFFSFSLSAIKLLPSLEVYRKYPRTIYAIAGYTFESLYHSLFNRNQTLQLAYQLRGISLNNMFTGISYAMDENGIYIGIILFTLFLIGLIKTFKKQPSLGLSFFTFLGIGFGTLIPIRYLRLWSLLHRLPIFSSERVPQRSRYLFMLSLAILCGFGFQTIQKYLKKLFKNKKTTNIISYIIILIILLDLFYINSKVLKDAFIIPPLKVEAKQEFEQIWQKNKLGNYILRPKDLSNPNYLYAYRPWTSLYPGLLADQGTINGRDPIPFPGHAIGSNQEGYKSEVYLKDNHGSSSYKYWSPNKLIISLNTNKPDLLVINQNYYPGWKIKNSKDKPMSFNGLLSVNVQPEDKEIELYYLPRSFVYGTAISSLSFIFVLVFLLLKKKNKFLLYF